MAKDYKLLRDKMSPERRANNEAVAREMLQELVLQELREAANLTQEQVAALLQIKQASVSKIERQGDMYLSTLQRYVVALGGKLRLVALFPGKEVVLSQFDTQEKNTVHKRH